MRAARRPAAALLLAYAGLSAELAWTRVAGLLFFGETAFLVVSLAVVGLSLGAAAGAARPTWLDHCAASRAAAAAGLFLAGGLGVALLLAGRGGPGATMAALVPGFAALGLALAGVFAGDARHAPRIYAADLVGAALGAAAAVPLLGLLGAPDTLILAAGSALAAAAVLAPGPGTRRPAIGLAVLALGAAALPGPDLAPAHIAAPKPLVEQLERGGERLGGRWGSIGRSELVRRADGAELLYLDGGAGSLLPTAGAQDLWRGDLGRFAFEALRPERVFVVGGGAGLEVAHALETGAREVLAAEVNGAGATLARERLAALRGGDVGADGAQANDADADGPDADGPDADAWAGVADPFGDPRARWVHDEARSVLRSSGARYDLIALSQAVTRTAEARGLALTENGIYTVEATRAWLDALTTGGAVAFELYDELTLTRVLITVATALVEGGHAASDARALDHLLVLLDPDTSPPTPLLLAFREAPTFERVVTLARAAERDGLALVHLPGLLENPPLDAVAAGSSSLDVLVGDAEGVDVAPTRDDAPFFWSFEPGVPRVLRRLLLATAAATLALAPTLILVRRAAAAGRRPRGVRRGLALAGLLGAAFLALELALLSRAGLLLGHPSTALATTLGGLLAGAGLGSALARNRRDSWRGLTSASLLAGAAILAWTWAWPPLAGAVAGAGPALRIGATLATLLPLGLALGAPFPLLLRRLGAAYGGGAHAGADAGADADEGADEPAARGTVARAWALNGLGSALGAAGAAALAHLLGFGAVIAAAAAAYLLAAAASASVRDAGA